MNEYLLNKYISLCNFENLRKKEVGWNFRCYICGDSKIHKRKQRGWVLKDREKVTYFCHNCGADISFVNFLRQHKQTLYNDYKKELLKTGKIKRKRISSEIEIKSNSYNSLKKALEKVSNNSILNGLLPLNKDSIEFCKKRMFPDWLIKDLKYSENHMKFLNDSGIKKIENVPDKDRRIVIPFFNEEKVLTHLQGRAIDLVDDSYRYITSIIKEDSPKIWGLDKIDKTRDIRICEGVFDACFVNNSIALASASGSWDYLLNKYEPKNLTFVLDNDVRKNPQLKAIAKKVSNKGVKLFFWPKNISVKDINDLVLSGQTDIETMINKNVYSGVESLVRLKMLR